jgi:hypothetical protein
MFSAAVVPDGPPSTTATLYFKVILPELRQRHDPADNVRGAFEAKRDGLGIDAHLAVAFQRREIFECHDAMRTDTVKQRYDHDRPCRCASGQNGGIRETR